MATIDPVNTAPPPPAGYASWLDYAVENFDTRSVWVEQMFEESNRPDREAMRNAARDELRLLRIQTRGSNSTE